MVDSGKILEDSFRYAKDGLAGKWDTWILLIISCIIFPLFLGYLIRIYRGSNSPPLLENWGSMFFDGIKIIIVGLVYALPILILEVVLFASPGLLKTSSANPGEIMGLIIAVLIGSIILVIVAILIWLIITTASVRFARTDNFAESFNFKEIFAHIGRIGWMDYIIALLMMLIVLGIIAIICFVIPYIGTILLLIMLPFLGLFSARYITLLYESAGAE
jgi:ABC-type multidrug transport system permease subunit